MAVAEGSGGFSGSGFALVFDVSPSDAAGFAAAGAVVLVFVEALAAGFAVVVAPARTIDGSGLKTASSRLRAWRFWPGAIR